MSPRTPRRRPQFLAAVVISCGLAMTVAVPATIDHMLPAAGTTEQTNPDYALPLAGERELAFTPPLGWQRTKRDSTDEVEFTSPDGRKTMRVWAAENVLNFGNSEQRLITQRYRRGVAIKLADGQVVTGNGFTGHNCRAINVRKQTSGACAVVGDKDVIVLVSVLSEETDGQPGTSDRGDVDAVVDSLELKGSPLGLETDSEEETAPAGEEKK